MRRCKDCFFYEPKANEKNRGNCFALPPTTSPSVLTDKVDCPGPAVSGDRRECGMFKKGAK